MNGSSTSEVETTMGERPSIGVPCHAGEWIIDKSRPDEGEYKDGT